MDADRAKQTRNADPKRLAGLLAAGLAAAALTIALSGCNTTEGVGKDVKSVGKGIEETAQDAK